MPASDHDLESRRWTAQQRAALVLDILRGTTTAAEAARTVGVTERDIEQWIARFLRGAENALRGRPRPQIALRDQEIERLQHQVDQLALDLNLYKHATQAPPAWGDLLDDDRRDERPPIDPSRQ